MGKKPHVAIIGAGFSGLRCADILAQNGAQVTVFEARNRTGGRVHQSKIEDHLVDLGPNWIHGTGKNPIVGIAALTETTIEDFNGYQMLFAPDRNLLDSELAIKLSEVLWNTIGEAFKYSNAHKDTIPPDRSLLDFFRERIEKTSLTPLEKELCIELTSTYRAILEHVSKVAIEKTDVRLNQPVVKIDSKLRDGLRTPCEVALTTATGETFQFDEVVVTCPLGWLKRNQAAFNPELPPRLTQAINNISYGRLEKVYVTFPQAFWHTEQDSKPTSTDGTPSEDNPTFIQFLDPVYTEHPEGIIWNQECISLAALPTHCAQPTLLFYTYGPCATYIVLKVKNLDSSSEEYYNFLDAFLHPFYSSLSGYSETSKDCKPLAFLATQWQNDPYAGHGSYCNFQVGLESADRDIEVLRAGVGVDRGVWFAGEHTAPFVALGTTTGAYWSGERAAAQICELYGLGRDGLGPERDDSLPSASGKKSAV
ncbi:hypothetical protein EYZ11_008442 [Aspergillus tanneri]|uniref:Amine oxidase domain-containing protein n=1 Tax=Aspergillus tanneri TaxID=1220188 RepID=A0A4S3JAF3_9EURO|nr:hypothetical protein EYZ11_008442 [Aspergillus tanneri]